MVHPSLIYSVGWAAAGPIHIIQPTAPSRAACAIPLHCMMIIWERAVRNLPGVQQSNEIYLQIHGSARAETTSNGVCRNLRVPVCAPCHANVPASFPAFPLHPKMIKTTKKRRCPDLCKIAVLSGIEGHVARCRVPLRSNLLHHLKQQTLFISSPHAQLLSIVHGGILNALPSGAANANHPIILSHIA